MVYLIMSSPRFLLSRKLVLVSSSCSKKEFGDAYENEQSADEAKKIMADQSSQLAQCSPAVALAVLKVQLKAYFN